MSSVSLKLKKILIFLIGDDRQFSIEQRLFNSISLINGVANILGSFGILYLKNYVFLLMLQLGTGIFFLICYSISRFKNNHKKIYWPFILVIAFFIFFTALNNGGLFGGSHYYVFPALVISIILARSSRDAFLSFLLFAMIVASLFFISQIKPDWISTHADAHEQVVDLTSNILFVEFFIGVIVILLMKNLNLEREKSDRLLVNILPTSIAAELKRNDFVKPQNYRATVLFTDFVGFTQAAEKMTPQELVNILDFYFTKFDKISRQYRLEKIKTIGDSYLAVGGIPESNLTHAFDCVSAALEIRDFVINQNQQQDSPQKAKWSIRIGIHTGNLIAGVIGQQKFAYDVWGDTVNIASRLESSGIENEVNVSEETYLQIKDSFTCESRGKIAIKNGDKIEMYLVRGPANQISS